MAVLTQEFVHVFIERGGTGLFVQHRDDKPGIIYDPNMLGVFGGHIDPEDESPEAAAIREVREELGLSVQALKKLGWMSTRGLTPTGEQVEKIIHAYSTQVDQDLELRVFEGQGGVTLVFGEPLPTSPQLTDTLKTELDQYYGGKFSSESARDDQTAA